MQTPALRIGTRGSPLALAQAQQAADALAAADPGAATATEIVTITTTGDRILDRPLADIGGKGLFTKEIDAALLDGRIDLAVNSAKDLETRLPDGIAIAACLPREDVRDVFISPVARRPEDLPQGARIGTSSVRRAALLKHLRPDLEIVGLRGNVQTRLRKLHDGEVAATLLAAAGLHRLGLHLDDATPLDVDTWLPAAGQGTIAITARADDAAVIGRLAAIDHGPTATTLTAERAFLAALDGSCRTPIGGLAVLRDKELTFDGLIVRPDGSDAYRVRLDGPAADAGKIGRAAGEDLAARGGPSFFADA